MLVPQKELLQRRKKLSGINKQGNEALNVMSKKLPKLKQYVANNTYPSDIFETKNVMCC